MSQAERLLDDLFEHAPVGLALLDDRLRYLRVNDELAAMNGRPAAEHVGATFEEVLGAEAAAAVRPLYERVLAGEVVRDLEVQAEGRSFRVAYLPATVGDGARGLWAIVVETTAALQAETALQLTEQRLRLALEGTRTGAWEWDVGGTAIRWSPTVFRLHGLEPAAEAPPFDEYLGLVHADDLAEFQRRVGAVREPGDTYENEFRVRWPDGTVRWLETRAVLLAAEDGSRRLVGITRDVTDRRRRQDERELLAQAGVLLSEPQGADETLARLADLVVPRLADWCTVVLPDDDAPAGLRTVAVAHADPAKVRWAREAGERYPPRADAERGAGAILRTGEPELYEQIPPALLERAAVDAEHLRLLQSLGMRSAMSVPLVARGRTIGVITFIAAESGRAYATADLELAQELGRRAGLAVDNALLLDAERDARHAAEELTARLAVLQRVVELGLSHLDLEELLPELLRELLDLVGADHGAVVLRDEDGGFAVRATAGLEGMRPPTELRPGQGIAAVVVERGATVVYEDLAQAPVADRAVLDIARSCAAVPLRARGEVFGVLYVLTTERRTFGPADVQLLELVAERAAQAIDHARLYERASATARTLQQSLLPRRLPDLPGLELAAHYAPGQDGSVVGGDWYDVFPMAGGAAGVAVGDVVGRGLRAAAAMGQLRVALKAAALEAASAAEPVARLHRFVEETGDTDFATLALLVVDAGRRHARLCSAGHFAPLLLGASGTARYAPVDRGLPIGTAPAPRGESTFPLEAGDVLVLFTDGLVERRDEPLDDRLEQLRAAAEHAARDPLSATVEHLLAAMGTDAARRDDVALVAVRVV